jgi:hypothetical protein
MQGGRWLSSEAYEEIRFQSACCADSASYFDCCSIRASQQIHLFSQGKAYLIEEKGYSDEPEVEYTYFAHDEVMQFSHEISLKGLKSGIRESSLKHIEPDNPY